MKHVSVILVLSLLMAACGSSKSSTDSMQANNERKEMLKKDLQKKALKQARKESKNYKKEGFLTFLGGLPLEKQIENAWIKSVDMDENGFPEYIVANARVVGRNVSAAKMQALHLAKVEIAGLMTSNIASLIESSVANNELSNSEAVALNKAVQASKELVTAELGRVMKETEVYRDLSDQGVEVLVCLSYSSRLATEMVKKNIEKNLQEDAKDLHQKLDKLLEANNFTEFHNTNLSSN